MKTTSKYSKMQMKKYEFTTGEIRDALMKYSNVQFPKFEEHADLAFGFDYSDLHDDQVEGAWITVTYRTEEPK